jgi:hypothetical protein
MTQIDPTALQWAPLSGGASVDAPKLQWQGQRPTAPPGKLQWQEHSTSPSPKPEDLDWAMPKPGKPPKWLYGVGPNNVTADYNTSWRTFGKGGIRPQFKSYVDELGQAGFSMGVYDFDRGHHYAPNDPHLDGRAMDVDSINGESVGTKLTPKIGSFIETALAENEHARVGVPKELYAQLPEGMRERAFIDSPGHVHVELTPDGMTDTHATPDPYSHMTVHQMSTAGVASFQLPVSQVMRAYARKQAESEAHIRSVISVLQRVPIQGIANVLGTPQRGVGEYAGGIIAGHNPVQLMQDVWHGLTDVETAQHATDSVRAALSVRIGPFEGPFVSRERIKEWVNESDIPAAIRPYLANAMNTTEDFMAQTVSDPLTYAGGLGIWAKGIEYGIKGLGESARTVAAIEDMVRAAKAGEKVGAWADLLKIVPSGLLKTSAAVRTVSGKIGGKLADTFSIRPDLSDFSKGKVAHQGGFTFEGKQRRMGTENSETYARNAGRAADQEAARHATKPNQALAAQYLRFMRQHGSQADSDVASRLLGAAPVKATGWLAGVKGLSDARSTVGDILSIGKPSGLYKDPQEVLNALSKGRNRVREYAVAQRTHDFVAEHPDSLRPGSTPQTVEDWRSIGMGPKRAVGEAAGAQEVFRILREVQRSRVMLFPYVHGIGNVGQISYFGAPERQGISTVIGAFRYMAGKASDGKLPGSLVPDEEKLARYGAMPTYVHEHEAPGIWNDWPRWLGGNALRSHVIRMQSHLQAMETGWRASLWDALERNPETRKLEPLIRGQMVQEVAGDVRNVAAFVRTFEQTGGVFTAYRLGIVPRAVTNAIIKNPQRVLAAIRPVLDIQQNRTPQGRNANTFTVMDPVQDYAEMLSSFIPGDTFLKYFLSPSTIGAIGYFYQTAEGLREGDSWPEAVFHALSYYDPLGTVANVAQWAHAHPQDSQFNPMPGQKMSLMDHLAGAIMAIPASFYLAKAANERYAAREERERLKKGEKFYEDVWDWAEGKGQ